MTAPEVALKLDVSDREHLARLYMPFIKNGGLFIATSETYHLGQQATILLKLLDEASEQIVKGKIVWITPKYAQNNRPAGVGIQFVGEQAEELRHKIESCLADKLLGEQSTDTM